MNQIISAKKQMMVGKPRLRAEQQFTGYKQSTKLFRRQVYEAARRNHSIDIDMVLPSISTRANRQKTRRFVNYKSTREQKKLENLMNISQLGEALGIGTSPVEGDDNREASLSSALEKEENGDGAIDKEKYKYLFEAKGFSID
jgi:hypothetical protein